MNDKVFRDREILATAHDKGTAATLGAFFRLSGPGWLQSAVTLGGGSLIGALFLGVLGGTSMLWLQLVAITIGVIMLSAISYVALSTNVRPYAAINQYINPVLGVGWLTATVLANMIWIIPQFSLCYDALDRNLLNDPMSTEQQADSQAQLVTLNAIAESARTPEESAQLENLNGRIAVATSGLGDKNSTKIVTSAIIAVLALTIVVMSFNPGWMAKMFDIVLKLIVAMIVFCFVAVVYYLASSDALNWGEVFWGFVPDFRHWSTPAPAIGALLSGLDQSTQEFWTGQIVAKQQESMIGVTATAVGLNMTFLLPYSMLARGWDKTFRGLARFDLITAMAIPYLIVTTCIVIASAHAFHAKADPNFLSNDPAVMQQSVLFDSTLDVLAKRYIVDQGEEKIAERSEVLNGGMMLLASQLANPKISKDDATRLAGELTAAKNARKQTLAEFGASLSEDEKRIVPTLVKPNAAQLATTLKPFLGEKNKKWADLIFGLGALGMGFSTIVILSLINGYAIAEMSGNFDSRLFRILGALAAITVGFAWWWIWQGESRTWLGIVASSFAAILLPIAYISFFALMNNSRLLGSEKPTGGRMIVWNVLMAIGCLGALAQAWGAISTKFNDPVQGPFVIGGVAVFLLLALVGFSALPKRQKQTS